jgi:hypothetical protein
MTLFCSAGVDAESSVSQLKKAFSKGRFVLPSAEELKQAGEAYLKELSGEPTEDLWNTLAIQRILQQGLLYLKEAPDRRTGRGLFALRLENNVQPWLIQAPHAKSDIYTGRIAARIFSEGDFKAAMWNSVPRNTRVENSAMKLSADMAHLPNTYWQAVTRSFALHYKKGKIIQFHGYAQSKRKTQAGRDSDVIISAGHKNPPAWVQHFTRCLKKNLAVKVSLYPYDVKELGATTNIQGHLLQKMGFDGFLHIELSKSMRKLLLKRKDLRLMLLNCIN